MVIGHSLGIGKLVIGNYISMHKKQKIGRWGEDQAADFLRRRGYQIIDRNCHCQEGEVDIVAEKEGELFFIEVKTRLTKNFGEPEEAFDALKREKFEQAVLSYLAEKDIEADSWQVGLVSVNLLKDKKVKIKFMVC